MNLNRRDFGRVALAAAAVPAGTMFGAKPNSIIGGVQIGTITYSYRGEPRRRRKHSGHASENDCRKRNQHD